MDPVQSILLEALREAAGNGSEMRLYRSGKLPGLFASRMTTQADAATQAIRDGLIEIVRTETRGKTTVEFVRITPHGLDFVLQHDSPARAMDELRDALAGHAQHLPAWLAELRREIDTLSQHLVEEVTRIGQRLDRLAQVVEATLEKAERARQPAPLPWSQAALEYLTGRQGVTRQQRCPLPELFTMLNGRGATLSIKDFHTGLRRLRDDGLVQLLPIDGDGGALEPEYALPDGDAVLYYAAVKTPDAHAAG
jgi:hypothetical protein